MDSNDQKTTRGMPNPPFLFGFLGNARYSCQPSAEHALSRIFSAERPTRFFAFPPTLLLNLGRLFFPFWLSIDLFVSWWLSFLVSFAWYCFLSFSFVLTFLQFCLLSFCFLLCFLGSPLIVRRTCRDVKASALKSDSKQPDLAPKVSKSYEIWNSKSNCPNSWTLTNIFGKPPKDFLPRPQHLFPTKQQKKQTTWNRMTSEFRSPLLAI